MTRILHYFLITIYCLTPFALGAQEFQKAFTDFNVANDFTKDQDGNLYTVGYTTYAYVPALDEIVSLDIINKLNPQGEVVWSKDFSIDNTLTEILQVLSLPNGDIVTLYTIDQIGESLQVGLARVSESGNVVWSKTLDIPALGFDVFSSEVNLFSADGNNFYVQSKKVNSNQQAHFLTKFNGVGEVLWTRSYTNDLKINASKIVAVDEDQLALIGYYTIDNNITQGMVMIMNNEGQPILSATFDNLEIQAILANDEEYILKYKDRLSGNAGLMKLDKALDVVQINNLDFEVEGQFGNFEKFGDDQVVLYVYDNRSRTELLAAYNMDGQQLWAKYLESKYSGRPFTEKIINADGKILMMSNIYTTALKSSIFRQMPADGNATQCILPIACVGNISYSTTRSTLEFEMGNPTAFVNPISISLSDSFKSTADFCEEAENVPSPLFDLDSMACVNQPVLLSNTNNESADDVNWMIEGGPANAILPLGSLLNGLPLIFPDTGLYTVTQFVNYQDCITSFSQQTNITNGLPFAFAEDSLILCQDEIETVNANRPGFVSYLWQDDNSPDPIKKIDSPGIYTVELFDGNCTASYDIVVEDFDYGGIEFSLGPDTTVCEYRRFPLAADNLRDGVDYIWSDGVGGTGERLANKEGLYTLTVSLDGCDYVDDIFVTFESCEPQIYMPNAFSPNEDGYNDILYPLGINFELESFRIYNRWGALIHDSLDPWDGEYRNQKSSGVYIYNISFLNFRSGDIETMTGSVFLQK